MFDLLTPNVVVVGNEYGTIGATVLAEARQRGIPALAVQHGVYGPGYPWYAFQTYDKLAVWGEATKRMFADRWGMPPDKLAVTGSVVHEHWAESIKTAAEDMRANLGVDPAHRLVLFATSFLSVTPEYQSVNELLITTFLSVVRQLPRVRPVIKVHPDDDMALHRQIVDRLGANDTIVVQDVEIRSLLAACDVLVTYYSTVAVEALLLGKPVVSLNLLPHLERESWVERGAVIEVQSTEGLTATLQSLLANGDTQARLADARREFLSDFFYDLDGRPSERVADLIRGMLRGM
jgi:UDP-N-acetylglucosamine 2-epimerase